MKDTLTYIDNKTLKEDIVSLVEKRLRGGLKEVFLNQYGSIECKYTTYGGWCLSKDTLMRMIKDNCDYQIISGSEGEEYYIVIFKRVPRTQERRTRY